MSLIRRKNDPPDGAACVVRPQTEGLRDRTVVFVTVVVFVLVLLGVGHPLTVALNAVIAVGVVARFTTWVLGLSSEWVSLAPLAVLRP
jgi:hypothetical protein